MIIRTAVVAIFLAANLSQAQGGGTGGGTGSCTVGTGFECSMVHASDRSGRDERSWVRAVVLWRIPSPPGNDMRDTARFRARTVRYTDVQRAAEDSGRTLVGTDGAEVRAPATMTWGFGRRTRDTLFVLGQRFELPQRDSALVIMIDVPAVETNRPAQLVASVWIPAALDPAYWPKHWISGDTSFTIRPRWDNRILHDSLMKSLPVRAFLLRSP